MTVSTKVDGFTTLMPGGMGGQGEGEGRGRWEEGEGRRYIYLSLPGVGDVPLRGMWGGCTITTTGPGR